MFVCFAYTQPEVQWKQSLGGSGSDFLTCARQTADAGYIMAGYSNSQDGHITAPHGGYDAWVVKTDLYGTLLWQKAIGGTGFDQAQSILPTQDGGYIFTGATSSNDGDVPNGVQGGFEKDCWIVKLDGAGNIQWQKTLGGTGQDVGYAIVQGANGGFMVAASTNSNDGDISTSHGGSDYWVIALDANGNLLWQTTAGGSRDDIPQDVKPTPDGGCIVTGTTASADGDIINYKGATDCWLVKLDNIGHLQWQQTLGGSRPESSRCITLTSDGGYIMAGATLSEDGDAATPNYSTMTHDAWLVKLDAAGSIQWQRKFGGTLDDNFNSIQQTANGGFVAAGYSNSNNNDVSENRGGYDYWMLQLDAGGNTEWHKTLGGAAEDKACSIIPTSSETYLVAGYSYSKNEDINSSRGLCDYWMSQLGGITLPVTLVDFTAARKAPMIQLDWATETEKDNRGFYIEQKQTYSDSFAAIAFVPTHAANGNSSTRMEYRYTYTSKWAGNNWYRIKQVNRDGKSTYSAVVAVNGESSSSVALYPNPVQDKFTVQGLEAAEQSNLSILDAGGRLLGATTTQSNSCNWQVQGLSPGKYYLHVRQKKGNTTIGFIKK